MPAKDKIPTIPSIYPTPPVSVPHPGPSIPDRLPPSYESSIAQPSLPPPPFVQPLQPQQYGTMPMPSPVPIVTPNVIEISNLRMEPRVVQCPQCGHFVETVTHYESGSATFLSALALYFLGCNSGCCLVPFCLPMCKDVQHTCPGCDSTLAVYRRLDGWGC
ncbi:hypothetical protein EC973_008384 [Apophysomyces ossiformis]|uniref:LITAF domain-containing protein n=1 Tax=Apophysomyces ossiformis TaxID=679940 RepID=A0A8H7BT16_9FUNG|nr:hypothetical protein EC973_008384 [Apophysomyces ossiformis]